MPRLKSIDEFRKLGSILVTDEEDKRPRIVVCAGTACQASGASDIIRAAKKHIIKQGILDKIALRITGCHGFCEAGPFVLTEPQHAFYSQIEIDDIPEIIDAVIENKYVERILYKDSVTGEQYRNIQDIPFFKSQTRSILGVNQKIDPIRIYTYIAEGGYRALCDVLGGRTPESVVEEVKRAGLRGRGGAGFPTGLKWGLLAKQSGQRGKILVCNADEGDPGAYMDRSILEGNPHGIIEGMIIGAFGTGATEGVIYVRTEYPLAIKHLTIAIRQCHELGLLGEEILGTGFNFDISIVRGAGAFVCGEETALMRSVEGKVGEPRQRPPFPVQKGIDGKPTVINNVETWANVPLIFRIGADAYAKVGTDRSHGTKIFSLVGKIKNTGLVEVPMGIAFGEIVYDIGGGSPGKAKIKAVQTGGPSGGCIPVSKFDLPIDYDSLAAAGSIMGSGGMIVMDETTCMVDVAKYYMNFLKSESCGKCFSCRKGTQRMYEILDGITKGEGTLDQLDLLEELAMVVKDASMCGLGQTAANPVLSTLKYFREEYEQHIVEKRCRALVCKDLTGAPCQSGCPIGTEAWRYIAHIRQGELAEAYSAIREANPFPSVCARVCNHPCEIRCRAGEGGGDPIAIRALKRYVTDRADPRAYKPKKQTLKGADVPSVAVVGAGPAGLTAAHYLSLQGYKVTIFEAEDKPGGMLYSAIPEYRLPREILKKEIDALIDKNVTLKCNTAFGKENNVDNLFKSGFKAIFLAIGAHESRRLGIEGENSKGVYPSMQFLKAHNIRGESMAKGRVGVVGGGNSAIDAARTAIRQPGVESVTILYRRTRDEMPAFAEEIEAAIEEGVKLETLVSPLMVVSSSGRITGLKCLKNSLGQRDASGRRKPVPIEGSEHVIPLDTLIAAIGEKSDVESISAASGKRINLRKDEGVESDPKSMCTNLPGVFAGGDLATGPATVVEAIAAGKKAAVVIGRYLRGEEILQPLDIKLPKIYVPAQESDGEEDEAQGARVKPPCISPKKRKGSFQEVDLSISEEQACLESSRCLRCDLEFTKPAVEDARSASAGGGKS